MSALELRLFLAPHHNCVCLPLTVAGNQARWSHTPNKNNIINGSNWCCHSPSNNLKCYVLLPLSTTYSMLPRSFTWWPELCVLWHITIPFRTSRQLSDLILLGKVVAGVVYKWFMWWVGNECYALCKLWVSLSVSVLSTETATAAEAEGSSRNCSSRSGRQPYLPFNPLTAMLHCHHHPLLLLSQNIRYIHHPLYNDPPSDTVTTFLQYPLFGRGRNIFLQISNDWLQYKMQFRTQLLLLVLTRCYNFSSQPVLDEGWMEWRDCVVWKCIALSFCVGQQHILCRFFVLLIFHTRN